MRFPSFQTISAVTYPCQPRPALGETQQAALRAAAPELPAKWGIELANWELEGGAAVCPGTVRYQPEP